MNVSEFCHLEIYFLYWNKSFVKPADPIMLFYHWCMIQNKFKCLIDEKVNGFYFCYSSYSFLF